MVFGLKTRTIRERTMHHFDQVHHVLVLHLEQVRDLAEGRDSDATVITVLISQVNPFERHFSPGGSVFSEEH
jgi:hypothetical protein